MSELDEGMGETARKRFVPRRRKAPLGRGDKLPAGEEGDNDGGDANERSLLVLQEDVHNPISEQSEKEPLRNRERKQTSAIPRDEYQSEQTGEKLPSSGDRMFRSDPLKELLARQRRLDRVSAAELPELHCVGQIRSCQGLVLEASEGACCRWRIDFDKAWQHLGGELAGQTHVSHCRHVASEELVLNHPIDLHFAETAMHVCAHFTPITNTETMGMIYFPPHRSGALLVFRFRAFAWTSTDDGCWRAMDLPTLT